MTGFHVAVLTAIIYAQIGTAFNDSEHQALKVQINDAKHAKEFRSLLNSIVNVNKERYDTLKKMTRLQQFPSYPPREALRAGESEDSSEDEDGDDENESGPEIVAYLVLPQQGSVKSDESDNEDNELGTIPFRTLRGILNTSSLSQNEDDESLRTDDGETTLRSCNKRGYKKCKRACKSAIREACSVYTCHRRFKKKFKKECKRSCKSNLGGDSSGSDSD